jgi:hypothetical protein
MQIAERRFYFITVASLAEQGMSQSCTLNTKKFSDRTKVLRSTI